MFLQHSKSSQNLVAALQAAASCRYVPKQHPGEENHLLDNNLG